MKIAVFDKEETKVKYGELLDEYTKAVEYVVYLVENPNSLADMHGLAYWAGVVENKYKEIKELV